MYILGSENIGQGYRRFAYLGNLSESANAQADNILLTQAQLKKEKARLDSLVAVATATRQQRQREYDNMNADEQKSRSLIFGHYMKSIYTFFSFFKSHHSLI